MGLVTEGNILTQAKKGQGETNQRLDALLEEQVKTNQWLAHIADLLERQLQVSQGQPRQFYPPAGTPLGSPR